jgi:hypothetical protein
MRPFPFFLSVVVVVREQGHKLGPRLKTLNDQLNAMVDNHELVVVENGSADATLAHLTALTAEDGQPDLQVYALNKTVERDVAAWIGAEHARGDYVAIFDLEVDSTDALAKMLAKVSVGCEVVFAHNASQERLPVGYRLARKAFHRFYALFSGVHLGHQAPPFRLLSKRVVNFILQHPHPSLTYRHLPVTGGFAVARVDYESAFGTKVRPSFSAAFNRGIRLLVSTTRAPLRLVTFLCAFGAMANLSYSVYVVLVAVFKRDVAPGWTSSSLQQSGMFFLLSLVLLVLAEYIMHMAALSGQGPEAFVKTELTSTHIRAQRKLNVRGADAAFAARKEPVRPSEFL